MTDELKKALEAAKTKEEMLAVAREYEHELKTLSDEELDSVAAGAFVFSSENDKKTLNQGMLLIKQAFILGLLVVSRSRIKKTGGE